MAILLARHYAIGGLLEQFKTQTGSVTFSVECLIPI